MKLSVGRRVVAVALDEGLDLEIQAAELLAESCGNDIRQCINALQMWAAQDATSAHASTNSKGGKSATYAQMKARLTSISKDALQRCSPYDGARMILSDVRQKSHRERCDAFFIDYRLCPLLIQQNYIAAASSCKTHDVLAKLDRLSAAADCLSDVDLVDERIGSQQYWGLLTTEVFHPHLPYMLHR